MKQVTPKLWIGNAMDARNRASALSLKIEAVIELGTEELPSPILRELLYFRIPNSVDRWLRKLCVTPEPGDRYSLTTHCIRNVNSDCLQRRAESQSGADCRSQRWNLPVFVK